MSKDYIPSRKTLIKLTQHLQLINLRLFVFNKQFKSSIFFSFYLSLMIFEFGMFIILNKHSELSIRVLTTMFSLLLFALLLMLLLLLTFLYVVAKRPLSNVKYLVNHKSVCLPIKYRLIEYENQVKQDLLAVNCMQIFPFTTRNIFLKFISLFMNFFLIADLLQKNLIN